jgi:ubiquinone/menaquinone biosynthesis C-methylase UbiE
MTRVNYRPEVFDVASVEAAKEMIVTAVPGATTEERWVKETAYLAGDIAKHIPIGPESWVLDYGCGIGRMSKKLIEVTSCRVVGVDFSKSMRLLATDYVLSERFVVWSPETLDRMIGKGFRVDAAISIWVIQHVLNAAEVLQRIYSVIKPGGMHYSLNQARCVPTDMGWINDRFDIAGGLRRLFVEEEAYQLPASESTRELSEASTIQVLRKAK